MATATFLLDFLFRFFARLISQQVYEIGSAVKEPLEEAVSVVYDVLSVVQIS